MDAAFASLLLNGCGVTAHGRDYLEARGLTTAQIFMRCCGSEEQFVALVIQPFIDGWETGEGDVKVMHKSPDDPLFTRGALCWARAEALKAEAPTPVAGLPAESALAVAPDPPAPPPPANPSPPKTLAVGEWQARINAYQAHWTPARSFPQKLLTGAEPILARMVHEQVVSRYFSPVALGEIVRIRTYTATGEINPLITAATNRHSMVPVAPAQGSGNRPVEHIWREQTWEVRGTQPVLDALEAIKWALVFAGWASDDAVAGAWTGYFATLIRKGRGDLEQIKAWYHACSWRLACAMREDVGFDAATKDIMEDRLALMEHLEVPARRLGRQPEDAGDGGGDRQKGRKGGGGKGEHPRRARSPYRRSTSRRGRKEKYPRGRKGRSDSPRRSRSHSGGRGKGRGKPKTKEHTKDGKSICKRFNLASGCPLKLKCQRARVCSICLASNHGAHNKRACSQQ